MTNKLGPCPLCGGEAYSDSVKRIHCMSDDCAMGWIGLGDAAWQALSTLAAQNKRRGEALRALRATAAEIRGANPELFDAGFDRVLHMCEEALK